MFKIKPSDIELYHWEQFDSQVQSKVLLTVRSLYEKEIVIKKIMGFSHFLRNLMKKMCKKS